MKIGNINIENNIFLAPMAGITDMTFRVICKNEGCGMTYTEMVSSKGLYYKDEKTAELMKIANEEKPCTVQIFGSDPDIMGQVIEQYVDPKASIIDINMGCPAPKVTKNGDGSSLMKNPKLIGQIVRKVSQSTSKPVTVKIRKGWDEININAVEIAKIAEENGAKAITVHGRTRQQFYSGISDIEIIREVKKSVSIPVIGNGDIFTVQDAKRMFEYTECDAIMVGRGSMGNPWIFSQINQYLENGIVISKPCTNEKIDKIIEHYNLLIKNIGEVIAIKEMRKHVAWYLKGIDNSNNVKMTINSCQSLEEVMTVLENFRKRN